MISVLLYGRNDGYGYNLGKRTAIGLNCLAEVLTHVDDEIHFVDCNSPDTFATLPEALADTLTAKCKRLLRVWRVRPELYNAHRRGSPLPLLESLSRNVALRRSNPCNRWVLSTNPDMIFTPKRWFDSLSKLAARQRDGFYELPRFELPESVWETFNRSAPRQCMKASRRAGDAMRLNYIVHGPPFARFAGLGDFQLALRTQLFDIGGFDEAMVHGWHVDTNLAKRLWLLNGETKSLDADLAGYHCGHIRNATLIHSSETTQNSFAHFVDEITEPSVLKLQPEWGAPDLEIELIRLDTPPPPVAPSTPQLRGAALEMGLSTGQHWHDCGTALTHVANEIQHLPRAHRIGYVGISEPMRSGLEQLLTTLGFQTPLVVAIDEGQVEALVDQCDLIMLDADLEPVSNKLKTSHRKLSSLRAEKPQGAEVRSHLGTLQRWIEALAIGAKATACPSSKRFLLRGLWASPLLPLVKEHFVVTLAAPALGFLPARVREA